MGVFEGVSFRGILKASVAVGVLLSISAGRAVAAPVDKADGSFAVAAADLSEVIVTGTNIRGVTTIMPVRPITKEDFERAGFVDIGQALRTLPVNFAGDINPETYQGGSTSDRAGSNVAGVSSANLYGLGSGATLTLLNGRRLPTAGEGIAVDLTLVPVAAIERVDVLADGASAVYGADAVAGVVNIVTRRDFEGLETRARVGGAEGGLRSYGGSILGGRAFGPVSAMIGIDYLKQDGLDASKRARSKALPYPYSVAPEMERRSYFGSLQYEVTPKLTLFADVVYQDRNDAVGFSSTAATQVVRVRDVYQYSTSIGALYRLGESWTIDLVAGANGNRTGSVNNRRDSVTGTPIAPTGAPFDRKNTLNSVESRVSGRLFNLPGGDVTAALGAAYREEELDSRTAPTVPSERNVTSFYGELQVPLVGSGNRLPLVESLDINFAGRGDDYSDAGSVFVPKISLKWRPASSLSISAAYSESFRAPSPFDLSLNYAINVDRAQTATGTTSVFYLTGTGRALTPEKSKNFSLNLTYEPDWAEGLRFSIAGIHVDYSDRIARPDPSSVYRRDIRNAPEELLIRNVTQIQLQELIAGAYFYGAQYPIAGVTTVVDGRSTNVSSTEFESIQASASYTRDLQIGSIFLTADVSYISKYIDQLLANSAPQTRVDTIGSPADWRSRVGGRWSAGALEASLYGNYVDGYLDNRIAAAPRQVKSWATFDASLSYDFGREDGGPRVILSVTNLFDQDPPFIAARSASSPQNWDPTNASIIGRVVTLQVIKRW